MTEKLRGVNVDSFEIGFLRSSLLHVPCVVNLSALINTKKEKQSRFFIIIHEPHNGDLKI